MLVLDTFEHKRSVWDQNHRGCWNTGSDWDLWCLCSPAEFFLWEMEVSESWLRWKEKAQKIFACVRHVCNPLSLYIRLLTVEN